MGRGFSKGRGFWRSKLRIVCLQTMLLLPACMEPSPLPDPKSDQDPKPDDGSDGEGLLTLQLARSELGILREFSDQLLIRVYVIENGLRLTSDVQEFRWPISEDGIYSMQGLSLGLKEVEIILLDAEGNELAKAILSHAIGPGSQTLEPVVLQPTRRFEVALNLFVQLNLLSFPGSPPRQLSLPPVIDQLFNAYSCYLCHSSAALSGELDLKSFPFQQRGQSLDTVELLASFLPILLERMQDTQRPMPPFGDLLKPAELAEFDSWLASIKSPVEDNEEMQVTVRWQLYLPDGGKLVTELSRQGMQRYKLEDRIVLEAGKSYLYDLLVVDAYGAVWFTQINSELTVPLSGDLELPFDVTYEEPTITIPIEVRR